jgi:hypothetical protein
MAVPLVEKKPSIHSTWSLIRSLLFQVIRSIPDYLRLVFYVFFYCPLRPLYDYLTGVKGVSSRGSGRDAVDGTVLVIGLAGGVDGPHEEIGPFSNNSFTHGSIRSSSKGSMFRDCDKHDVRTDVEMLAKPP